MAESGQLRGMDVSNKIDYITRWKYFIRNHIKRYLWINLKVSLNDLKKSLNWIYDKDDIDNHVKDASDLIFRYR